ncbi:tyrosine-type recombinase/integrase [Rahnella sp. ChDrAdgB13]|uniref:tyrosine-type recombinase/integrase n=1 Tax=Rahnella sp. ChDrAdgB13 TaxID=1850581 RepID=UPI001AD85ABA|nr:tyrosine-type recombinase/integrase [Rahnella sp. ChDrAdgB13]
MKRKYLTKEEMEILRNAIHSSIFSLRDKCMINMAYIHGLRVSELISLRMDDYSPSSRQLYVRRLKGGLSTLHPVNTDENTLLLCWLKERERVYGNTSPWLFLSRRGEKLSRQRFYQIIRYYGVLAGFKFSLHPHMLRHACGYYLADRGNDTRLIQDYLGHKNIRHTVLYTATNAARFMHAWG